MTRTRNWGKPYRFKLQPCDEAFFASPTRSFTFDLLIPAPQELVFDALMDGEAERLWFPHFKECRWITPPVPAGERDYRLRYMGLMEKFVTIERPGTIRFYGTSCSLPLVRRFGETTKITARAPAQTRLQWQIVYEPHPLAKQLQFVLEPMFEQNFRRSLVALEQYLVDVQAGRSPAPTRMVVGQAAQARPHLSDFDALEPLGLPLRHH